MNDNQNKLIETTGIIKEIIDDVTFKVVIEEIGEIIATISRKINLEFEIYVGEEVPIHISPYDLKRGRIYYRYWIRDRERPNSNNESNDKKKNWF